MGQSLLQSLKGSLKYLLSRWPVLLHDAGSVVLAWLGAYWFRFNLDQIPSVFLDQALAML